MRKSTKYILLGSILTVAMVFGAWNNFTSFNQTSIESSGSSALSLVFVVVGIYILIKGLKLRKVTENNQEKSPER